MPTLLGKGLRATTPPIGLASSQIAEAGQVVRRCGEEQRQGKAAVALSGFFLTRSVDKRDGQSRAKLLRVSPMTPILR